MEHSRGTGFPGTQARDAAPEGAGSATDSGQSRPGEGDRAAGAPSRVEVGAIIASERRVVEVKELPIGDLLALEGLSAVLKELEGRDAIATLRSGDSGALEASLAL